MYNLSYIDTYVATLSIPFLSKDLSMFSDVLSFQFATYLTLASA